MFDVVEKKIMIHDNREWYKVKSVLFSKPMTGFHNPDMFSIEEAEEK